VAGVAVDLYFPPGGRRPPVRIHQIRHSLTVALSPCFIW